MSGRELQRIEVLSEVLARRRTEISAAAILGLSTRQTRRLLAAHRDGGGGALIHKARSRTSNNRLIPGVREYVIELVRSRYADSTLAGVHRDRGETNLKEGHPSIGGNGKPLELIAGCLVLGLRTSGPLHR